jgi:hypothetical protein
MRWLVLAMLVGFAPAAWADDPPKDAGKDGKAATPAAEFKALMSELQKKRQEAVKAYREAKTDEERQKSLTAFREVPQAFAGRAVELAKKYPKDKVAVQALSFVALSVPQSPQAKEALAILLRDHVDELGSLCTQLAMTGSSAAEGFLRSALAKTKNHEVQAEATLGLAQIIKNKLEQPGLKADAVAKLSQEAEELFAKVVDKFSDVKSAADTAKRELFEIRNLAIGKEAPDIAGVDGDGKKFKLSDYRGKVVVLDFWANW